MGDAQRRPSPEGDGVEPYIPQYSYPGQWFDDMGSLAMTMGNGHSMGIDLAESHLSRDETNRLASLLLDQTASPYE